MSHVRLLARMEGSALGGEKGLCRPTRYIKAILTVPVCRLSLVWRLRSPYFRYSTVFISLGQLSVIKYRTIVTILEHANKINGVLKIFLRFRKISERRGENRKAVARGILERGHISCLCAFGARIWGLEEGDLHGICIVCDVEILTRCFEWLRWL